MNTELIIALISAAVAIASAILAIWGQMKSARLAVELEDLRAAENRRLEREKSVARYREPLGRAAYDLQSRLYNIIQQKLIKVYLDNGSDRERTYVINNTVFLAAQYFAWTEIIRRDIQFLDLGADDKTRELARLQDRIYSLWQTDGYGTLFRVFAGEQRAIGERMICDSARGPDCMGYASFLEEIQQSKDLLLNAMKADVQELSSRLPEARARLIAIQNAMIDLLDFLDPNYIHFPKERRTKIAA
jgi:hypothetical protein